MSDEDHRRALAARVLARITGARKGVLFDAWLDTSFARAMLEAIEQTEEILPARNGPSIQTALFKPVRGDEPIEVRRLGGEQSNTSLVYGERLVLKLFRRLQPGLNPEYEIGRQLTERIGYPRVPAVTGAFEHRMTAEQPTTIGCCSSSSRARLTAGAMPPTRSAASMKMSRQPCPSPTARPR